MPEKEPFFLARSLKQMQEYLRNAGPAAGAGYTLFGAIFLLGGIGYWVDARFGTKPWFLAIGLLLGIIVGLFELAKTIWRK
jgi:F0F1-type ATP synthase assembly protein I